MPNFYLYNHPLNTRCVKNGMKKYVKITGATTGNNSARKNIFQCAISGLTNSPKNKLNGYTATNVTTTIFHLGGATTDCPGTSNQVSKPVVSGLF